MSGAEPEAGGDQGCARAGGELAGERFGSDDDQGVEGVGGGGLGLDDAVAGHSEGADGFDRSIGELGLEGGCAVQDGPGGGFSIDGVGLASLAAESTLGRGTSTTVTCWWCK